MSIKQLPILFQFLYPSSKIPLSQGEALWLAQGEKKSRGEWGLGPGGLQKFEFSSPGVLLRPAVPVYFIHSVVTSGVRQPPHVLVVVGVGRI